MPEVGLAELGGVEHERVRAGGVLAHFPDDHAPVSRGARGDRRPGARALEQLLRGARKRGDAQVERRAGCGRRRGPRLDERNPKARGRRRRREQRRRAGARHGAADHDDVEVELHARRSSERQSPHQARLPPGETHRAPRELVLDRAQQVEKQEAVAARAAQRRERQPKPRTSESVKRMTASRSGARSAA